MNRWKKTLLALIALVLTGLLAGCGGDESSSSSAEPQKADFTLAKQSDIGLRDGFATFTSRSDGKTSVIIDFYVERTEDVSGDVYAVAVQKGSCDALGDITTTVGDATNGISTFLLDEAFDEVVGPVRDGSSSIVIMGDGGQTVAWCGASENPS